MYSQTFSIEKIMTEIKKLFASPRDESARSDAALELNYQESA